jgi:predicted lipoprotein with Yx(FWY)xxD motif
MVHPQEEEEEPKVTRIGCALCLVVLLAFAIAGCGGSAGGTSTGTQGGEGTGSRQSGELTGISGVPEPEGGIVGVLRVGKVGGLESIVIDRGLHTVYVFSKDNGTKPSCENACATRWPPMITETNPIAMPGIDASKLGTIEREDGSLQVTYAGHPLYDYLGDTAADEANGNDIDAFGGQWHVIGPDGEALPGPAKGAR